jgi:hypothetical protein
MSHLRPIKDFRCRPTGSRAVGRVVVVPHPNQTRLIDYGREYCEGHRISTARVESTVDQMVDWRMEKKQHMRWTRRGAQMLLHARRALLNGELGKYTRWSASESSQALAA